MADIKKGKKIKKQKVKVDGDVIELRDPVKLSKSNIFFLVGVILIASMIYYFAIPAINIQSVGFLVMLVVFIFAIGVGLLNFKTNKAEEIFDIKASKWFMYAGFLLIAAIIIFGIASAKLFNSRKYASLITIENSNFSEDIVEQANINDIAIMDTESARIIGNRAIGSLSEVVSQYEVSEDYSTIDLNGKPMKVATLEYAGFFKWVNNKREGIPGYVLVDPVLNEAKYVKLTTPIKYTTSGCFNDNLQRHVQFQYPTYIFEGYHFELDNDGNPYYICPVLHSNAGLFGAKDVKGVVVCNPCTGDSNYYDVADVPKWVDRVYDGDLVERKYDWYGTLSGGFWNSVIGNKGCKVTTDDYGYKVMDGDVWIYTGVTSVNSDESNIGFVMINLRTCECKYYEVSGAEEYSAMSSAEGQVQNLGYNASFPSLINISNQPTYIMALKDDAGLVKMYALVNVQKYNIVATGKTQNEALAEYKKLLTEYNVVSKDEISDVDLPNKQITIKDIKFVVIEGDTTVYITDQDNKIYKEKFSDNEMLVSLKQGDNVKVYYQENENGINDLISFK